MGPQKSGAKCVETVMPDKIVRCGIAGITTQRRRSLSDRWSRPRRGNCPV